MFCFPIKIPLLILIIIPYEVRRTSRLQIANDSSLLSLDWGVFVENTRILDSRQPVTYLENWNSKHDL